MTQVNQPDFAYSHNDAQLQKYSNPEKAWIELINNIQQKIELESKRYSTAREMYSFEETPYQPPADPRILSAARVMSFHDHVLVLEVDLPSEQTHLLECRDALLSYAADFFDTPVQAIEVITRPILGYEDIWVIVKKQLQSEMPRASFDTWVKDSQAVSFHNNILIVVTRNSYVRDWLSSRVCDQVITILSQFVKSSQVDVRFIVEDTQADPEKQEDEPEENEKQEAGSSVFSVEPVDLTRYQNEVHPDRVVMLEGYALRLMEQGDISPKEMSLWVGFKQAIYLRWKNNQGVVKNIPHWEVVQFAMMSRASYFRETSGRESMAGGLIEEVGDVGESTNDRRFDNAKRYRVHMAPRLTRRDCAVIEHLLTKEIAMAVTHEEARANALKILSDLAENDPGNYLDMPNVEIGKAWPRSVADIVRRVLEIRGDMPSDLHTASEKVQDRILLGFGKVFITHYFLKTVAPELGLTHPQAWAIIALRDRCWYDHTTRSQKDFALLPGGLDELGSLVGVDRKTVKRWLTHPGFSMLVNAEQIRVNELPEGWDARTTIFTVRQEEPLIEEMRDKVSTDTGQSETRLWKKGVPTRDKVSTDTGQSEHGYRTKRAPIADKVSTDTGQNEHRLNNLNKPQDNPKEPQGSPPVREFVPGHRTRQGGGRGNRQAFWDFEFLATNNLVQPGSKTELLRVNKKFGRGMAALSRGFVSWLLYAYSPAGVRVKDPVALAVKRLREQVHAGAGGEVEHLAGLSPFRLQAIMDADLAGLKIGEELEVELYERNFHDLEPKHKRELYARLFGMESIRQVV